jgi:glycogen synthase
MPNYLHVNARYFPFIGGSEYYMQQVAQRLAATEPDARVEVFTTDAWDLEHFWQAGKRAITDPDGLLNGVNVRRFQVRRVPLISPLFYPALRRLMLLLSDAPVPSGVALPFLRQMSRAAPILPDYERALKSPAVRYDLLHTSNTPLDSLLRAAFDYARRQDAAFVVTPFVHLGQPQNPGVRRWYTMRHHLDWLKRADAVFTMTSLERDFLAARGVPEDKMHIVGCGLIPQDIEGGDGAAFRQKHNITGKIVFTQGALAFEKGTHHTVQAMQQLWRNGYDATLVLAGPVLSEFRRYYDELPASDRARIRFLGFISAAEKRDLFAAGDVFVMPSRTDSFGIVYLEAWQCGKPVIGARAGGVPALVSHERDGLLVDYGAVSELADAIKILLDDFNLAQKLGYAGQRKVAENYTWEVVFGKIHSIYQTILGTGKQERRTQMTTD